MRAIALGFDGFDPDVAGRLMEQGRLPNLRKLKDEGTFARLATTVPPQSPVAWASFATGANPGKHGVFDFLRRDPATYLPDLSLNVVEQPRFLKIGRRRLPLGRSKVSSGIRGTPFWRTTSERGISTTILRCPLTFPPEKVAGSMLSGLGTPDLLGTQGTFAFYTTNEEAVSRITAGRIVPVSIEKQRIRSTIAGPRSPAAETFIPFDVVLREKGAAISVDGTTFALNAGEWSGWITVRFNVNAFTKVSGICRFYLKSVSPHFELYLSPLNFDPSRPAFPVSYPRRYSRELARDLGLFHTLGQAGDTWALNEGVLSEETAMEQYSQVADEDERILFHELGRFRNGVFFFCFGVTDTVHHMFPAFPGEGREDRVAAVYERADRVVGKITGSVGDNTLLIILSDHGFGAFDRAVHLNTWLKENEYLALKEGGETSDEFFGQVDWGRTRAYAVGLSGIYINRKGREREGIVGTGGEAERLAREISGRLEGLRDPATNVRAVKKVYRASEVYSGPFAGQSPDLVVGFCRGYRASWQTALGGAPGRVFEDNAKKWRGDHIFDAGEVPGVLFMSRKSAAADPRIIDIAPTILKHLGVAVPDEMEGVPLL